jgi:indole-3-acetate monooxygenase
VWWSTRAEAAVDAARLLITHSTAALLEEVRGGRPGTPWQRARVKLAQAHGVEAGQQAIDAAYALAGTTAVYATSRLDRIFRDVHTAAAHRQAGLSMLDAAGRVRLGLDPGSPFF